MICFNSYYSFINVFKKQILFLFLYIILSSLLNVVIPLINSKMVDEGFVEKNTQKLLEYAMLEITILIINSLIIILQERKRLKIWINIKYSLEERAFSHLQRIKLSYFNSQNCTEILSSINTDVNNMSSILNENSLLIIGQMFNIIGGIVGIVILNHRFLICIIIYIIIKLTLIIMFSAKKKGYVKSYISSTKEYAEWFGDTIGGIKNIKLYDLYKYKIKEFSCKKKKVLNDEVKINMNSKWNYTIDNILVQIVTILMYIMGLGLIQGGKMSIGQVLSLITFTVYIVSPISTILNIGFYYTTIIPSAKRYYKFIDYEEEKYDTGVIYQQKKDKKIDIELKNIFFAYDRNREVFNNFNLYIPTFRKIAIVGDNGTGKSTLLNLILHINEPLKGEIYIGGRNIRDYTVDSYRKIFSVVDQNPYLFNDSIRNNIALYKNVDDTVILDACELCGLGDFIKRVTIEYKVGNDGNRLSVGEKQKIALARAIVQNRPIILLDEATSNIDKSSINQINKLLNTCFSNKTVVVVTHQTEILMHVDETIYLRNN